MRWVLFALLMLATGVMLTGCGGTAAVDPQEIGDPARGQEIYTTGAGLLSIPCVNCHTLEEGGSEKYGPSLVGISAQAGERVSGLDAVEYLRQSIVEPSAYVVEGFDDNMEKFYSLLLSEEDIDHLVAFMLTQ